MFSLVICACFVTAVRLANLAACNAADTVFSPPWKTIYVRMTILRLGDKKIAPERDKETAPIDVEWELAKANRRWMDVLAEIEKLRQDMKSINAKIARLKLTFNRLEGEEEPEEEREWPTPTELQPELEELTDMEILKLYEAVKERGLLA